MSTNKKTEAYRVSEMCFKVKVSDQSGDSIPDVAQPFHHLSHCLGAYARPETLRLSPSDGISLKIENLLLRRKHPTFHVRETFISLSLFSLLKYCGLKKNNIVVCFSRKNITLLSHFIKNVRERTWVFLIEFWAPIHPRSICSIPAAWHFRLKHIPSLLQDENCQLREAWIFWQ